MQVADGLAAAHEQGLVHRDVKPANILLPEGVERVKITDFGLARAADDASLTRTGVIAGTPLYMSPEQVRGGEVDHRTDICSLGVVLYEMITGQLPFRGEATEAVSHSILYEEYEPLTAMRTGVPIELDRVVGKMLAKSPAERYQHMDELVVDLRAVGRKSAKPGPLWQRRWLLYTAAAVAVTQLAVAVVAHEGFRLAHVDEVVGRLIVLADVEGVVGAEGELQRRAERRVLRRLAGADEADARVRGVVVDEVGLGVVAIVRDVHRPVDVTGDGQLDLVAARGANRIRQLAGYKDLGEGAFTARRRHIEALQRAHEHFVSGQRALDETRAGELLAEELRLAHQDLGVITGAVSADDLLGRIFADFCIGK